MTIVMGVLNVTPDSFSDGGRHDDAEAAIAHGRLLASQGAGIVDVGGESTRPGAARVPEAEEMARVIPVVAALAAHGITCSVDTMRASVARVAVAAGGRGRIINVASTSGAIFTGNYSAIKAWARTWSTGLALELSGTGVTVTALLPGWVRTEFHQRAGISATNLPSFVWIDADELVRQCLRDVEKGRIESVPTKRWKASLFVADHGPRKFIRWFSRKLSASRRKR